MSVRFRIVFRGDISLSATEEEVRENLQRLTGFDEARLNKLFSGAPMVLKDNLDQATATRYKAALDATGALCSMEAVAAVAVAPPPSQANLPGGEALTLASASSSPIPGALACPACGQEQSPGPACQRCGIIFAKYRQAQERKTAMASGHPPPPRSAASPPAAEGGEGLAGYFARHREQAFILKAFALILVLLVARQFVSDGLLLLAFFLFPVLLLLYARLTAAVNDQSPWEVLAQHITLMPVMYATGEKRREEVAWVTYCLILLNIFIFYAIQLQVDPQLLANHFFFIPLKPSLWSVPMSAFTSMFLHAGHGHLWGNMVFLWALGTVVEKRLGGGRFLALYLGTGLAASMFAILAHLVLMGSVLHALGASGAIAGVMGIFAVRCYFKSMVFPLPILGIFSLILPLSLKVRLNSLVIIGLFFLADLSGGFAQVSGTSQSMVGHWIHIGGMLAGVFIAMALNLGQEAIEERHLEIGAKAVREGKGNLEAGEDSLRQTLLRNPDNPEALLLLAQLLTRHTPTEEGAELFRRAIALLAVDRPQEAALAFREYYGKYLHGVEASLSYRLAGILHQQGDLELTSRCLEATVTDPQSPAPLREKALFQLARVLEEMGLGEAAAENYNRFIDDFPASAYLDKARLRLAALAS
jgi:membrane associated rhomboid family serine protease/TolA-binding protein